MSARRPRPRVGRTPVALRGIALWSIGLLTAVLGIASLSATASGATPPASAYGSAIPPAAESDESLADRPTPRSWLGAALSTSSVTGAGTDRRHDSDPVLPSAVGDHADHRFAATASQSAPGHDCSPVEQASHRRGGIRAPPSSQS